MGSLGKTSVISYVKTKGSTAHNRSRHSEIGPHFAFARGAYLHTIDRKVGQVGNNETGTDIVRTVSKTQFKMHIHSLSVLAVLSIASAAPLDIPQRGPTSAETSQREILVRRPGSPKAQKFRRGSSGVTIGNSLDRLTGGESIAINIPG